MDDSSASAWITLQATNGFKVSIGRENIAEAVADARALLGDERFEALLASLGGGTPNSGSVGGAQPVAAPAEIQRSIASDPAVQQPTPAGLEEFATCKCGKIKNRWVAGGISSKTNKQFPGFWGCEDRSCRLR